MQLMGQKVRFRHLGIDQGLLQNAVQAMVQDKLGYIWIGTRDGLNRYDGYSFKIFKHSARDTNSIASNFIVELFEDSQGRLWVGHESGAVDLYDRDLDQFIRLNFGSGGRGATLPNCINAFAIDPDGKLWIGARTGLYAWRISNESTGEGTLRHYDTHRNLPHSLDGEQVLDILIRDKEMWIATNRGISACDYRSGKVINYQIESTHPEAPTILYPHSIFKLADADQGDLWLGTLSGLVKFHPSSGSYEIYSNRHAVKRYGWGRVADIVADESGILWLATQAGLMRFDTAAKTYEYTLSQSDDPEELSYDLLNDIFKDTSGIMWVGTNGFGINIHDPKGNRFGRFTKSLEKSRFNGFSIRSICYQDEAHIWISSEILHRWNRTTNELISFEQSSDLPEAFGNTGTNAMLTDNSGNLWLCCSEGIFRHNDRTNQTKHYTVSQILEPERYVGKDFSGICFDGDSSLWAFSKTHLCKMVDVEKGLFQTFSISPVLPWCHAGFTPMYCDRDGVIWLGTEHGLTRFNTHSGEMATYRHDPKVAESLRENHVKWITPDPSGKAIWLGTAGGGLHFFDKKTNTFSAFTEADGLPNSVVYAVLPDEAGNLWVSTNKGLARFDPKQGLFQCYDANDNLQSNEFNTGAACVGKDGELFFGGLSGINYFNPTQVSDNPFIPPVNISDVRVRGERRQVQHSDSRQANAQLTLAYAENVIRFTFAAMDFTAPEKNLFSYRLEPFDSDWSSKSTENTATYTNLSPGTYTLTVRASNNDGVWNEVGTALTIHVLPPWWRTWWAYSCYALCILFLLYFLWEYEIKRLRIKNQLEVSEVSSASLKEIDRLKTQFFANVSHELRTPLTLILGQLESVRSEEITKKNQVKVDAANRQAQRLLELINHLLDLSKVEAGKFEIRKTEQDLSEFLVSRFLQFDGLAEERGISLEYNISEAQIRRPFDPDLLEKVLSNLISNALKFTQSGGTVALYCGADLQGVTWFSISDTGAGITAKELDRVFDRFYQVDSKTTLKYEGSGIGLSLARELIEAHGGRLEVASTLEVGTTFTVFLEGDKAPIASQLLPTKVLHDLHLSQTEFIHDGILEYSPKQTIDRSTVLIVEDNREVAAMITEQLQRAHHTLQGSNGRQGLKLAYSHIPDLIVTDVMMPEMDGHELVRTLRADERTNHIPIIMLTGKAGIENRLAGLETGIDVYLTKPYRAEELLLVCHNLLTRQRGMRAKWKPNGLDITEKLPSPDQGDFRSIDSLFLEKLQTIIQNRLADANFLVDQLSEELNMSPSQLHRKVTAIADTAPGQMIRASRLAKAKAMVEARAGSISEIGYACGFSDLAYFSRAFKKEFGKSPKAFGQEVG